MKVQRIRLPEQTESWLVLDDKRLPISPIQSYLHHLEGLEYSPNTIHNYATHLKQFWEFLRESQHQWDAITVEHLADFIRWLRHPASKVIAIRGKPCNALSAQDLASYKQRKMIESSRTTLKL